MKYKLSVNKRDLARLLKLPNEFARGFERGMSMAAKYVEGQAKLNFNKPGMPTVRTGNLRRSITSGYERSSYTAWVGATAEYSRVIEMGGGPKNIKARPYLQPAVDNSVDKIVDIIETEISKEMNRP